MDINNPYEASPAVILAPHETTHDTDRSVRYQVPFGTGETIGVTFRVWSESLIRMVIIQLIPAIPVLFLLVAATVLFLSSAASTLGSGFDPKALLALLPTMGIGLVLVILFLTLLITTLFIPALIGQFRILDEQERHREYRTSVLQAWLFGFRYLLPTLGLFALLYIAALLVMSPLIPLFRYVPIAGGLYVLAFLVFLVFCACRLAVVLPVMVLESRSIPDAIQTSIQLVKGHSLTVLGIYVVFGFVISSISMGLGMVGLIPILGQLILLSANLFITALQTSMVFAIYAGLRTRHPLNPHLTAATRE